MGRRRGPLLDPAPGDDPLDVYSIVVEGLAGEQRLGRALYGQAVLDPAARITRAPALYPHGDDVDLGAAVQQQRRGAGGWGEGLES